MVDVEIVKPEDKQADNHGPQEDRADVKSCELKKKKKKAIRSSKSFGDCALPKLACQLGFCNHGVAVL